MQLSRITVNQAPDFGDTVVRTHRVLTLSEFAVRSCLQPGRIHARP